MKLIKSTVYPLGYNKNNPMAGFNKWNIWLKAQVAKSQETEFKTVAFPSNPMAKFNRTMELTAVLKKWNTSTNKL